MKLITELIKNLIPQRQLPLPPIVNAGSDVTYEIGGVGQYAPYIKCLRCNKTSYSMSDVKHRYCGYCKMYHERWRGEFYEIGG